jgi:hypothetical protein
MKAAPWRRDTRLPKGRPGSELKTAHALDASASMIGREERWAISSSDVKRPVNGHGASRRAKAFMTATP